MTEPAAIYQMIRLFRRNNLYPIAVRIFDKIDPHIRIFITDAVHILMFFVGGIHIVRGKGQVDLIVTQIIVIRLPITKPGKLQLKAGLAVRKVRKDKAAVPGLLSPCFLKP